MNIWIVINQISKKSNSNRQSIKHIFKIQLSLITFKAAHNQAVKIKLMKNNEN